jgi:hypothetical protein
VLRLRSRRPSRDDLYAKLLDEKDTQLRILAAEIDWLRAQIGRPSLPAVISPGQTLLDSKEPGVITDGGWESEADEARKIISENGLSAVHLPEILDGLGLGTSDLS